MDPAKPLADEFCRGHSKRFLTLNRQFRTEAHFLKFMQTSGQYESERGRPNHVLEAIPDACGIDRTQYLRLHSMLPFTCFGESETRRGAPGTWLSEQERTVGSLSPRSAAYLCGRCVEEDKDFWHVSYWRRAHQLPGLHACSKHSDELLCAVVDADPFARMPEHWLAQGRVTEHPAANVLRADQMVRRFLEICEAMLDGGRCWSLNRVRTVLRQRAVSMGICATAASKFPLLSDLAIDQFPAPFLTEVFAVDQRKRLGKYFHRIDAAVCTAGPTPSSLALAMTLLYPSNEDALSAWLGAGVLGQTGIEATAQMTV